MPHVKSPSVLRQMLDDLHEDPSLTATQLAENNTPSPADLDDETHWIWDVALQARDLFDSWRS